MNGSVEVRVEGVAAGYGVGPFRRPVLAGVTFTGTPGRITAVVGPNGAGKTTLFRILLGFRPPWAGSVRIGGRSPGAYRRRHGIGFLPEVTPRPRGWTPASLFEEGCHLQGLSGAAGRAAVATALERSGLGTRHRRTPLDRLSRGMARRAVLSYALLGDPRVVLLDEPLSGLDATARIRVRDILAAMAAGGSCILLSSHELDEVARLAHAVVVLGEGRPTRIVTAPARASDLEGAVLGGAGEPGVA